MNVRSLAILCALLIEGLCFSVQAEVKLPDTRAGHLMGDFLKLCDAPDVSQIAQWAKANLNERRLKESGADGFARNMNEDCVSTGGYELLGVMNSKPDDLLVFTRTRRTDVYYSLHMGATPQGKAIGIGGMPATPPESALPKEMDDKPVASFLGAYTDKLAQAGEFSGIAMIARGTEPIVTRTAGYANRKKKTPITPQTQFTLGSMGKLFTATAVGQLVDQGKLSYDDTVGKFFPKFANKTIRDKVTVGMLLSHTSGMGDFLDKRTPDMMKNGVKRASDFVPLYENDAPQFEPGTSWSYSNAGLALAGAIVEKASGEDYPAYIRKHIFDVAGMRNSDANNIPHMANTMVTPYTHEGPTGRTPQWQEAEHDIGSPAGGALSTAEDLVKFADALRSGKLVSKATFALMTQPHGHTPGGREYGYGMSITEVYGRKVVGHGGGFPGVSTELFVVLDSPYTAVVLANQDPPAAEVVGEMANALAVEKAKR